MSRPSSVPSKSKTKATAPQLGLAPRHWDILNRVAIAPLKEAGFRVYAFGSRARGDFKKFSDLDLLVVSPGPNAPGPNASLPALLSKIGEGLEESTLPIRVDLVLDWELAESYRPGIERDKLAL